MMTEEEKAAMVERCQSNIAQARGVLTRLKGVDENLDTIRKIRTELRLQEIALAALTAEPRGWLTWHAVPPTLSDPSSGGEYLAFHEDKPRVKNDDGTDSWPVFDTSPAPAIPDGWRLVPLELTDEMGEAIALEARCCGGIALDIYDAALKAAPTP